MNIDNYVITAVLAVGFIGGTGFFIFWRFWRRYLAPPEAMCDRAHIKVVNYFWFIVTGINFFIIYRLLRIIFHPHWVKFKEAFGLENVPYL